MTPFPKELNAVLARRRTALLVYDMQVGILRQIECGAAKEAAGQVLEAARRAGLPIFHTRHISLPKRLMGTFAMRQAMAWQRTDDPEQVNPWFLRSSPGTEIAPEFTPRDDEAIVEKIGMSAFEGTYLEMAMRDLGLDSFILVGVAMEIGLDPTIRHATDLGFVPIVVHDACGAGHAEAAQRSLENVRFMGDAMVVGVSDLISAL